MSHSFLKPKHRSALTPAIKLSLWIAFAAIVAIISATLVFSSENRKISKSIDIMNNQIQLLPSNSKERVDVAQNANALVLKQIRSLLRSVPDSAQLTEFKVLQNEITLVGATTDRGELEGDMVAKLREIYPSVSLKYRNGKIFTIRIKM